MLIPMNSFGILFTIVTFAVVCITNSAANAYGRDYHRLAGPEVDYIVDLINKLARSFAILNGKQEDYLEAYDPEGKVEVFNRLARKYDSSKDKKWPQLDLGLNRGHSAAQIAKIKMAQILANNPNGPGRRRRSVDRENHFNRASSKANDSPAEDRQVEKIWR